MGGGTEGSSSTTIKSKSLLSASWRGERTSRDTVGLATGSNGPVVDADVYDASDGIAMWGETTSPDVPIGAYAAAAAQVSSGNTGSSLPRASLASDAGSSWPLCEGS